MAPPGLPPHFQPRPDDLARLSDIVLVDLTRPVSVTGSAAVVVPPSDIDDLLTTISALPDSVDKVAPCRCCKASAKRCDDARRSRSGSNAADGPREEGPSAYACRSCGPGEPPRRAAGCDSSGDAADHRVFRRPGWCLGDNRAVTLRSTARHRARPCQIDGQRRRKRLRTVRHSSVPASGTTQRDSDAAGRTDERTAGKSPWGCDHVAILASDLPESQTCR